MVLYTCERCGYTNKIKTKMKNHLMRKNSCRIVNKSLSVEECYLLLFGQEMDKYPKNTLSNPKNMAKYPKNTFKYVQIRSDTLRYPKKNEKTDILNNQEESSKCPYCDIFFKENYHLIEHIEKTHFSKTKNEKTDILNNREESSKCPYCDICFNKNHHLIEHIEKTHFSKTKNEKTDILNNREESSKCPYCDIFFKENRYLKQHIKKYHFSEKNRDFYTASEVIAKLKEKDDIIIDLRKNIAKLLEKVGSNNTYNTYNIVNINPFGKENTSYVTDDYISSLIKSGPYNSIPKLLKYIHFHPKHSENHNVKIPNKKLPFAQIFNGEDWEYRDKRATIESLSNKAYTIINSHYNGGNDYMNKFKEQFNDNSKTLIKRVNKDIELAIINSQKGIYSA